MMLKHPFACAMQSTLLHFDDTPTAQALYLTSLQAGCSPVSKGKGYKEDTMCIGTRNACLLVGAVGEIANNEDRVSDDGQRAALVILVAQPVPAEDCAQITNHLASTGHRHTGTVLCGSQNSS